MNGWDVMMYLFTTNAPKNIGSIIPCALAGNTQKWMGYSKTAFNSSIKNRDNLVVST